MVSVGLEVVYVGGIYCIARDGVIKRGIPYYSTPEHADEVLTGMIAVCPSSFHKQNHYTPITRED